VLLVGTAPLLVIPRTTTLVLTPKLLEITMEEVKPPGWGPHCPTGILVGQLVFVRVPMICGPKRPAALTKLLRLMPGGALLPQL